ncbi:MAG: hypothetical protein AB7O97_04165 [Planctomycetota bacterium]
MLLFGGSTSVPQPVDTWEWDGAAWLQVATLGPPARYLHAMVFDVARQRTVLFGGLAPGAGPLQDTWEWDGGSWSQVGGAGPVARSSHAMAYDALRFRTVLFGGGAAGGGVLGDTWLWDGGAWTQQGVPGPPGRAAHAMAFDAARGQTVMMGGLDSTGIGRMGDTWTWDGSAWMSASVPLVDSAYHSMAFDPIRSRVVSFGGFGDPALSTSDVWEWDGASWTLVSSIGPLPFWHAAAFDGRSQHLVSYFSDGTLWSFEPCALPSSATPYGVPCGSPPLGIAAAAASRPRLGDTFVCQIDNVPSVAAGMAIGTDRSSWLVFSLPFPLTGFGMPGCWMHHDAALATASPCSLPVSGASQFSLGIPFDASLLGLHIYLQAWALAPGANAFGAIVSGGLDVAIGDS